MDYYTAMEEAMIDAREDSFLPTKMTRDDMVIQINGITRVLKDSLPDSERIILSAKRQELSLRLRMADEVAQRLMGK